VESTSGSLGPSGIQKFERSSAKMGLALELNRLIERHNLSQSEVAEITGMTQPKVSQVRRCALQNISLERLMQALVSFEQSVEIVVRPATDSHPARIAVMT
jgi:predicted XRE-type DNA-binding protein